MLKQGNCYNTKGSKYGISSCGFDKVASSKNEKEADMLTEKQLFPSSQQSYSITVMLSYH